MHRDHTTHHMAPVIERIAVGIAAALLAGPPVACSPAGTRSMAGPSVLVVPPSASVQPGGSVDFDAVIQPASTATVNWSVQETPNCGTITGAGLYTAAASAGTCHVTATVSGVTSAPAEITVGNLSACASEPMRTTGTKYYFCDCQAGADPNCVPGNNAWDGLTPSTPKQTGWKSRFTSMAAGSTVALCSGGSFTGDNGQTINANCQATPTGTCDLRDYVDPRFTLTSGMDHRPVNRGGRLAYFWNTTPASQGYRFFNLQAVGVSGINAGQGIVMGRAPHSDVDICNVYFHDAQGLDYGVNAYNETPPARWTVRQCRFERLDTGYAGGSTDGVLDANYFANDSYVANSIYMHPIYLSGNGLQRMKVTNNEVHGCAPGTTTGTVLLVAHVDSQDMLVENNLIQCDDPSTVSGNDYGISFTNGAYSTTTFPTIQATRTVIRRNWIVNTYYRPIDLCNAPDSIIEDNLIVTPPGKNDGKAIGLGSTGGRTGASDPANSGIIVRNNTVYLQGSNWDGIIIEREGTGYVVTNNVVYQTGGSNRCFNYPLPSGSYALLSNNACNATWNTTYDSNRVTLSSSPFVSAGTDFTPAAGSPLENTGTTTSFSTLAIGTPSWSATDQGKVRDAQPDIGAFER